jgi:serine protease Do
MAQRTLFHPIAGLGLAALLLGTMTGAPAQEPKTPELTGLDAAAAMEKVLVDVIARAEKSVVAIARVRKDQPGEVLNLEFQPDPFGRRVGPIMGPQPTDPDFIPNEYATGVVIDPRGLILTVYHALGEGSDYYVTTSDRKVRRATVKAADPRSDLAVLAIEATDLVPITFGDASTLQKGRVVIALGNPYAIARDGQVSAAWGIVANLARKAPLTPGDYETAGKTTLHHFGTLIQTDARLNLGTSGGPLVDLGGRMVGLVTSLPASGSFEREAGYAIPVDPMFRRAVDRLKEGREVEYGFLGIQPANLAAGEVLDGLHGMRVQRVQPGPGTPAAGGAIRPGDVITAVNGQPIYDADGLVLEVGRLPVEATVRLSLLRGGRNLDLDVTLGKYPVRGRPIITVRPEPWRGLRVDYPTVLVAEEFRSPRAPAYFEDAVIVTEVEKNSPAWESGIRPGMFISHVGSHAVRTPTQFRSQVAALSGPVRLRLTEDENPVRTVRPGS